MTSLDGFAGPGPVEGDVAPGLDVGAALDGLDVVTAGELAGRDGALFAGDDGGLTMSQRGCLVAVLKNGYVSAQTHPEHWATLVAHRSVIAARLNDLFLTLHFDEAREVAFKRQAVPDDSDVRFPTLLRDDAYNRYETVLLVALRERLQRERAAGADVVIVDAEELVDAALEFLAPDATDVAGESSRAAKAVERLVTARILLPRDEGRFAVAPVLDALLPLERLRELLEWLRSANGSGGAAEPPDPADPGAASPLESRSASVAGTEVER